MGRSAASVTVRKRQHSRRAWIDGFQLRLLRRRAYGSYVLRGGQTDEAPSVTSRREVPDGTKTYLRLLCTLPLNVSARRPRQLAETELEMRWSVVVLREAIELAFHVPNAAAHRGEIAKGKHARPCNESALAASYASIKVLAYGAAERN